jgi:glycosyltransferase involved in cell wall biosynthesis
LNRNLFAQRSDLDGMQGALEYDPRTDPYSDRSPPAPGAAELAATTNAELSSLATQWIKVGRADEAFALLELEGAADRSPQLRRLHSRLAHALTVFREQAPDRLASHENTSIIALHCVLKLLAARRSAPAPARRLEGIALMTGHLGAGGAELQMTRTAEMLATAAQAKQSIAGVKVAGPIHVVVKSLAPEADRTLDFFLPRLARKNVPVCSMDALPAVHPETLSLGDADVEILLWLLHPNIRRGLCLVPWFKRQKIRVAYIWQDNPILHFAIAAMLAGVPQLVLNFRGMPPVLRWKEHLDEYKELYSALAAMPGVTFVSNSSVAAEAYSKWIGCPRELFHVMLNGTAPHAPHPLRREIEVWSNFKKRTKDATITIGTISRMHPNKRPLEWIRFASHFLDSHPNARFIMIGTGMLSEACEELATRLRIKHRLLRVRQTRAGEFWLKQMDAFVLLSRFEGTPNVLIEAQFAGVPVVCTPVANAKDTFIEGVTGMATASSEYLDIEDVVAKVDQIVAYARAGTTVRDHAQRHIASRFSNRSMIEHTVRVLSGRAQGCCDRGA